MNTCFVIGDNLLRALGNIVVFYSLFKSASEAGHTIPRSSLLNFTELVKSNRAIAETIYEDTDYDLLEYDRLTQHGTNDVSNIKERLRIIQDRLQG